MRIFKSKEGENGKIHNIPPYLIYPNRNHVRTEFPDASLALLASSIRRCGVLVPLIVRCGKRGGYELVAGERRLRAAVLVGLGSVPCIICQEKEEYLEHLSIVENCARENLSLYDKAKAVRRLVELQEGQINSVARLLSLSPDRVEKLCGIAGLARSEIAECGKYREDEEILLMLADIPKSVRLDAIKIFTENNLYGTALDSFLIYARHITNRETLESTAIRLSGEKEDKTTVILKDLRGFYSTLENACRVLTKAGVENTLLYDESETEVTVTVKIKKKDM